nr:ATP synthase F0 subunit 6 [Eusarima sp.]
MMTSLFSSFDPSSNSTQMNWIMMMMPMIIMPMNFWLTKSRWNLLKKKIEMNLSKELSNSTKHKEMLMMSTSVFMIIMTMNLMSIFPYTFTPTAQMSVSISLALPLWMMLMIYGWSKYTNSMFIHLLPVGTPTPLMPMMIMIETVGNVIRPISLSVRLTANMIAGHLMMTLLGNMNNTNTIPITMIMQMILMSFESAISIIQAYVFSTLITLYSSEIP